MSKWEPWENRFRSWTPRSPSAKLKARLFPDSEPTTLELASPFGGRWTWLAPVMGCFLMFLGLFGAHSTHYLSPARSTDWPATVAGNQGYASYIMAGFHSEQNSPRRDPIEWTNAPRITEGGHFVPSSITNSPNR